MQEFRRHRSRLFRALLVLAVLAWTAFAFEAVAHPLATGGRMRGVAPPTSGQITSVHCQGMHATHAASAVSTPAPPHPVESGHGCCAFGHCSCASFCSSIAGVPLLAMTWPLSRGLAPALVHAQVPPATAAPHLRPPIA